MASTLEAYFYGFDKPYPEYLAKMHEIHQAVASNSLSPQLMLLEHAPVITITRQHADKSLKTSASAIRISGIDLQVADRGGDATFHGPGQLVGYPIIPVAVGENLLDVESHIRKLESALLLALKNFGLNNVQLLPGFSGIWVKSRTESNKIHMKKLAAIGVGISQGVSKHGFALNIDIDYEKYAEHIIPCGLKDRGVSTLKEAFLHESLEMPAYLVMVEEISRCIATTYDLSLKWRRELFN